MTIYLTNEELKDLIKAAVDADLTAPGLRDSLLMGIHRGYVNTLPVRESPLEQLRSDLARMNSTPYLAGSEEVPLRIWLGNATHHLRLTGRLEVALLQRLLDEVDAKSATVIAESSDAQSDSDGTEADYDAIATALREAYATHEHAAERGSLSISITGAGNVVGDHNTVFVTINQRYPLLSDYAYDVGKTIAAETEWFTGRAFVFEWLETQLHTLTCGYLRLIADAGLGKTAIAAEMARRYNAVVHFINAAAGITRTDQCLNALAVQLIVRYGLKHDHLPERAGLDSDFLQTLLQEASSVRGDAPILLVIDALDEADASAPGRNWLHLPQQLPQGVFILLTHRPGDYPVAVAPQMPQPQPLRINWDDATQQKDIEAHLRRQAGRPDLQRALASATPTIAVDTFVQALQSAAEGNFMYLAYVLADIARREPGFDPLDLQALPRGLDGYYGQFWAQMEQVKGQEGWAEWKVLYRSVIELLGVAGEPVTAEWLAAHTGREAEEITERALSRWARFLRDERRDGANVWSTIHRSFADFLAGKVNLPDAHRRVAGYYLQVWGGWETDLPGLATASGLHGGYGLRHLATHLNGAAWWEPLRALFESDTWLQARLANDGYIYDGYLNDLELAWRHSETQIGAGDAEALAECMRYALIYATVNSVARNYEPELIIRAVEVGFWTPERALSVAAKRPDARQRAELFTTLIPMVPTEAREPALAQALAAAREIEGERSRAEVLAALAPQLTGRLLAEALAAVREIAYESRRAEVLAALAPQLTGRLLAEALAAAREIEGERSRAEVLAALAPQLTGAMREHILSEALAAARGIADVYARAKVLEALAPQLTGRLLAEALAAVRGIADEYDRAFAFAALAPQLRGAACEPVLIEILTTMRQISDWEFQRYALEYLASHVIGDLSVKVLAAARASGDEWFLVHVLEALAPQLAGTALDEALSAACEIEDQYSLAEALKALAPQLTGTLLDEALASARKMTDEKRRANVLATLAPPSAAEAHERVLAETLATIHEIENEDSLIEALAALAPQFTAEAHERVLAETLATLAPQLTSTLPPKVLASARANMNAEHRANVLAKALEAIHEIETKFGGACAQAKIPPTLANILLAKTLAGKHEIADGGALEEALVALAPMLTGAVLESALAEALVVAREIVDEHDQAKTLAEAREILDQLYREEALVPEPATQMVGMVDESILAQTIVAARDIESEEFLAAVLAALAPQLAGNTHERVLAEALAAACEIKDEKYKAKALVALAPQANGWLLAQAFRAMGEMMEKYRARTLSALAPIWTGRYLSKALVAAREIRNVEYRVEVLVALAPHLIDTLLAEALVAAREIRNEEYRAEVLVALAPQLTGDLLAEALAAACEIEDESTRAEILAEMAPHLTGDLLAEALTAAREIADESDQARVLAALLSSVSGPETNTVKQLYQTATLKVLRTRANQERVQVLYLLADKDAFNPPLLGLAPAAVERIATAVVDICRRWRWV